MKRVLATFSGARYFETTKRIVEDAPSFGVDEVRVYDDFWLRNLRPAYWERMSWFRERKNPGEAGPRGIDWFAMKSLFTMDAFSRLDDGDVLLVSDADTFPIADLGWLYERCVGDGGVMLFNVRGCVNRQWTKRDCFILMGCDEEKYWKPWQTVARFMLFEKGAAFPAEEFLGQWLGFTANPILNTFEPSILGPDYPELIQHRCEQSVLTNLSIRYGVPRYREACEFGCWDEKYQPDQERDIPHQFFSQRGSHSYRPDFSGDESEGSSFRNVVD